MHRREMARRWDKSVEIIMGSEKVLLRAFFVTVITVAELIRAPHRRRNRQDRRQQRIARSKVDVQEVVLMLLATVGMWVLPPLHLFSRRLDFADWALPRQIRLMLGAVGSVLSGCALWLLWRAHADLGTNWSPSLEIRQEQQLVTGGVYRWMRHPIYAALWLLGLAQVLMLQNWISGPAGLLTFWPVYRERIQREERMMAEQFGDAYRRYSARTGRILPRL